MSEIEINKPYRPRYTAADSVAVVTVAVAATDVTVTAATTELYCGALS